MQVQEVQVVVVQVQELVPMQEQVLVHYPEDISI